MNLDLRHLRLRPLRRISTFRKLALKIWDSPPRDPTTYGDVDIDMTSALAFLKKVKRKYGEEVTVTHLMGRALAQVMAERPLSNVIIRRFRLYQREDVDIFFMVAITEKSSGAEPDLSGFVIRQVDQKGLVEVAREFREKVEAVRKDTDPVSRLRKVFAMTPGFVMPRIMELLEWVTADINIKIPGFPHDPYGSAIISNVGTLGIPHAYIPLVPYARCPFSLGIGALNKRPYVVESTKGDRIEIRPVLTLSLTVDHRIIDGLELSKMMHRFLELMSHPEVLLKPYRRRR